MGVRSARAIRNLDAAIARVAAGRHDSNAPGRSRDGRSNHVRSANTFSCCAIDRESGLGALDPRGRPPPSAGSANSSAAVRSSPAPPGGGSGAGGSGRVGLRIGTRAWASGHGATPPVRDPSTSLHGACGETAYEVAPRKDVDQEGRNSCNKRPGHDHVPVDRCRSRQIAEGHSHRLDSWSPDSAVTVTSTPIIAQESRYRT